MNLLLPAPLLIPLFCAILSLLARKSVGTQRFVAVAGCFLNLLVSACLLYGVDREGIQVVQAGSWPAPYGISLVVDRLSAIMLVLGRFVITGLGRDPCHTDAFGQSALVGEIEVLV